jgi:hypothetical protein
MDYDGPGPLAKDGFSRYQSLDLFGCDQTSSGQPEKGQDGNTGGNHDGYNG